MIHPRKPITDAMRDARELFFDNMRLRLVQHENHMRVTSIEAAYNAAAKMSRTLRASIAHLEANDIDAVCSDLSAYIMVSECAESALRMSRYM